MPEPPKTYLFLRREGGGLGFDSCSGLASGCSDSRLNDLGLLPRGSIYPNYGIRPPKNHPYFGFGDLIP